MTTTLKDFGRHSDRFGDIGFYYAFEYRLYFGEHQLIPEDIHTWCRENCRGYYKITAYTHETSVRDPHTGEITERYMYADKVYLADPEDVMRIKLSFEVRDTKIKRPRLKRKNRKNY